MDKLLMNANKIWRSETAIACAFMSANVLLIVANVILRRFFNAPIFGATEMVRYLSLVAAGFALAQNEWIDGNITMSLIHEKLSTKAAARLRSITNCVVSVAFIIITYLLYVEMGSKFANVDVSYELNFPLWLPALVLAVGFTLLTISVIIKTILLVHLEITGGAQINFRDLVVPKDNQAIES